MTSLESSVDHLQRATECLPSLSPRQSVDSGVSSTKEQFHIPKILIGQSSEEEVPESRSEFDTDSGIELPSVTQLKAMFNQPKDTQGDTSVKRVSMDCVFFVFFLFCMHCNCNFWWLIFPPDIS